MAFLIIAALALIAMWVAVIRATAAHAHDWYAPECCGGQDCGPVLSYSWVAGASYDSTGKPIANPLPQLQVTTKNGTAVVPSDMHHRESHDNQMHACIRPMPYGSGTYVLCIFDPPTM